MAMLHYSGDLMALELGKAAREPYIRLYHTPGMPVAFVPFFDLDKGRKRYVKYEWLAGQWVFVDVVDEGQ